MHHYQCIHTRWRYTVSEGCCLCPCFSGRREAGSGMGKWSQECLPCAVVEAQLPVPPVSFYQWTEDNRWEGAARRSEDSLGNGVWYVPVLSSGLVILSLLLIVDTASHAGDTLDISWSSPVSEGGGEHKGKIDLQWLRENCYSLVARQQRQQRSRPLVAVS